MVLVIFFLVYLTLACKELEETNILFIELGEKLVNIDSQKKVEINANELIQVDDYILKPITFFCMLLFKILQSNIPHSWKYDILNNFH